MTPVTSITVFSTRQAMRAPAEAAGHNEPSIVLDRVAKGLRGARARTGLSEADVIAILERQDIALSVESLRLAETTGEITLGLAACLADVYGTTTDGLAGRRLHRTRLSLDDFPCPE